MSSPRQILKSSHHRLALPVAALVLAALGRSALAQTAPQLLPYTVKLIAGGGTAAIASGATCPVSGFKSTDAYGDGCLATEILIAATTTTGTGPHDAVVDSTGAVFFVDGTNGLVRRVDPITHIVTAVAGGATSSPASGTACGSGTSTDALGDGCPATSVKLSHPVSLVFSPAGDLYVGDYGSATVRKIAATGGLITTTGTISMVDGQPSGAFGYTSNSGSTTVVAATGGYLDAPFALAFDNSGNLYIADEGKSTVVVVNTNATTTTTVTGISIPPGTVAKIIGSPTAGGAVCPNSPASPNGCNFGLSNFTVPANSSPIDGPYGVALDPAGDVYVSAEFYNFVGKISSTGAFTSYAGMQNSAAKKLVRGPAGSFSIGSTFGLAADVNSNLYVADASSGVIWRVDGAGQSMYVVAGGATTVCSAATDASGDGCPALQSTFGSSSGTGSFATTKSPGPGVFGISVDAYSDLFAGDTETGLVREVASGTQFGNVGATQTDIVDIHFAAGDSAAAGGYTLTSGASIFSLGTPSCTTNSDTTTDCLLPITAAPSVLGPISGTLQVQAQLGGIATFPLTGNFVQSPVTRTVASATGACGTGVAYSPTAPVTLTATLVANGPSNPTGSIIFYANGTALPPTAGVPVTNLGSASAPLYGANLSYTFSTPGTYAITATYSGDGYFKTSTSSSPVSVTSALPTFTTSAITYQQNSVVPGQTALYSFNVNQTVYNGTITFAASGLPANSSISFSPASITASGCSTTNTVAVSIFTQQGSAAMSSVGLSGDRPWGVVTALVGLGLALGIGLRRRRAPLRYSQFWMALALLLAASGTVACNSALTSAGTPAGTYNPITITATGSTGTVSSFPISLIVN